MKTGNYHSKKGQQLSMIEEKRMVYYGLATKRNQCSYRVQWKGYKFWKIKYVYPSCSVIATVHVSDEAIAFNTTNTHAPQAPD